MFNIAKKQINIYLETTAGQGTELCYKLEDLKIFYDRIKANPKMKYIILLLVFKSQSLVKDSIMLSTRTMPRNMAIK